MITRKQLEDGFEADNNFMNKIQDSISVAIQLLRSRIPYDVCQSIVVSAEHDIIYLCDVELALPYLTEDDIITLADCNMSIDSDYDCLFLFV